jgi:hypothetical protein
MIKILEKITLLTFTTLFIMSCSKDGSGDVSPETVQGKWVLQNISSSVEYKSDSPETSSEDVSNQGLYFDFAADGTYTTNGAIELGNITDNNGTISTGNYEFSKGVLNLTYNDPDLGIPITLYLNSEISGNDMKLSLDKSDLVEAFAKTTGVDAFTQAILQIVLDEIIKFEYSMTLKK